MMVLTGLPQGPPKQSSVTVMEPATVCVPRFFTGTTKLKFSPRKNEFAPVNGGGVCPVACGASGMKSGIDGALAIEMRPLTLIAAPATNTKLLGAQLVPHGTTRPPSE